MSTKTPDEILHLVDEHAYLGMSNEHISQHLRESHWVSENDPIPGPSPSAAKARERYLRTGRMEVMPGSTGEIIYSGFPTGAPGKKPEPHQTFPLRSGVSATHEEALALLNADLSSEGMARIKAEVFEEDDARRQFDDMLMHGYSTHGPTLLDRIVRGYANIQRVYNQAFSTEPDLFVAKEALQNAYAEGRFKDASVLDTEGLKGGVFELRDMAIWPWFDGVTKTENIQISLEMAERFRQTSSAPGFDGHWEASFLDHPIYIDISGASRGDRYISGIFCRPLVRGGKKTFEFKAIVEWAGIAWEAILCGEYNHDVFWVDLFSTEEPPGEVLNEMYEPLMQDLVRLIPAAWVCYRSQSQDQNRELGLIRPASERDLKPKKQRAKEKTHSYFKVVVSRNTVSAAASKGAKRWTLNHMITVSGHFRWQPYGPGRSQLKLIWIDPYDKGHGEDRREGPRPLMTQISN